MSTSEPAVGIPESEAAVAGEQPTVPPKTPSPTPPAEPPASAAALQLQAMFPSTPMDIIETVLMHDGTIEAASETLLAMGDPSWKEPPPVPQIDADAQMARMLEEEDRAAARRNPSGGQSPARGLAYAPYVPRRGRATSGAAPPSGSATTPVAKDELDQLAEGFSKLAEQGKKTLGSFFSKVKDQINALDGPGASASSSQAPAPVQSEGWTPPSALPRPQPQAPRSQPIATTELLPRPTPAPVAAAVSSAEPTSTSTTSPPSVAASASTNKDTTPEVTPPLDPKKDFSKIGLLPRQSISLLDANKGKGSAHDDSDDDEDLEYVRSPFDDD